MPLISIITPNYNYGRFIERALRSVLLQGYPNLEYIVVDGGSSDDSRAIIEKYAPWLVCINTNKPGGLARDLNEGLRRAHGTIVAWLGSDDFFLPGAFDAVARQFILDTRVDAVVGRCQRVYADRRRQPWIDSPRYAAIQRLPVNHAFSQTACFFRAALLDRPQPLDETYAYALDLELWTYFKAKGIHWKIIDAVLSVYYIHGENKTTTGRDVVTREFERIYKTYCPEAIPLTWWHRTFRYPLERFLARRSAAGAWLCLVAPLWMFITLVLGIFYGFDRAWHMRWKRWAE